MKKLILVSLMLLSYASLAGTHAAKFYNNWTGSGTLVDPLTYDPPYWRPDLITPFLSSWALTNKITPASTHVVTSIAQSEPRDPYQGAVALPNGTALLIPCCSSYFGIVDQSGNYSHGAAAPAPVSYDFYGGIYVSNLNIVVCVPYNTANVWRYNVKDGTLTQGASHLFGVNKSLFNGGCMAPNGKVIFAPFQSSYVGVYDPVLDTYSNGPATPASHCYAAASVMTNGLVIFTPAGYNNIGIYDPVNNTLVNGPHLAGNGWATDGYQYVGSCNTIDGRIAMSSASPHTVGLILYGPDTNTFVKLGSATTGGGCCLMPDGRILRWSTTPVVNNTVLMTVTNGPTMTVGWDTAFFPSYGCLLPNGKVVIPQEYINYPIQIYDCLAGRVDTNITLNCFVNH